MAKQDVAYAVRYRVLSSAQPVPGVVIEFTVQAPGGGEATLPAVFLPADTARNLHDAIAAQIRIARGPN